MTLSDVKIIAAEPQVQITFTANEFRVMREALIGRGTLKGAWAKIIEANRVLEATTAPRSYPRF